MIPSLLRLELLRETRARDVLTTLLLVGALVVVVADLAYHDLPERAEVTAGTLWLGVVFAAALALARGAVSEADRDSLDTLLTMPVSRASVFLASAAANALLLLALVAVLLPFHLLLAGGAPAAPPLLVPVVVLGVVGVATAGTLLAAVAARTRAKAVMLPVLLLPVVAPVLVAALHATVELLHGGGWAEVRSEVMLLAGYDVAFLAVSALLYEHAVEG